MMKYKDLSVVRFFGLSIVGDTKENLLISLHSFLEEEPQVGNEMMSIFTPNPEQLVLAHENKSFYSCLRSADILLPDGSGLVWAMEKNSQVASVTMPLKRISGREVFHDLLVYSAKKNLKVFLLGGREGSSEVVIKQFRQSHTSIDWQYDDGPRQDVHRVLEKISHHKPDIVFVAYGAPHQEQWVNEHTEFLQEVGVRIAMVVGGAIDYESGRAHQVPSLVTRLHLEWLFRLVSEPWRWRRQLTASRFFLDVMLGKYN